MSATSLVIRDASDRVVGVMECDPDDVEQLRAELPAGQWIDD